MKSQTIFFSLRISYELFFVNTCFASSMINEYKIKDEIKLERPKKIEPSPELLQLYSAPSSKKKVWAINKSLQKIDRAHFSISKKTDTGWYHYNCELVLLKPKQVPKDKIGDFILQCMENDSFIHEIMILDRGTRKYAAIIREKQKKFNRTWKLSDNKLTPAVSRRVIIEAALFFQNLKKVDFSVTHPLQQFIQAPVDNELQDLTFVMVKRPKIIKVPGQKPPRQKPYNAYLQDFEMIIFRSFLELLLARTISKKKGRFQHPSFEEVFKIIRRALKEKKYLGTETLNDMLCQCRFRKNQNSEFSFCSNFNYEYRCINIYFDGPKYRDFFIRDMVEIQNGELMPVDEFHYLISMKQPEEVYVKSHKELQFYHWNKWNTIRFVAKPSSEPYDYGNQVDISWSDQDPNRRLRFG